MVSAFAPLALAAALLCLQAPAGRARLAALRPSKGTTVSRRGWPLAPVVIGGLTGLAAAGPGGALAGAVVAAVVRQRRVRRRAASTAAIRAGEIADTIGRLTEELRAGSHPAAALAGITADGPHAREVLGPAAVAAQLGDDVPGALRAAAANHPAAATDLHRIAAAWALSDRHGIQLATLLDGVQSEIRWRLRFGEAVRAHLAGPRATAAVLTVLPALGLALGQLLGLDPLAVLKGRVLGQALLVVGVGLVAGGAAWSERIVSSAIPR
ncbi:type II secretion system F family protein [Pseudonocardia sp. TRM90224]|uniref:type II secretion system F family protein n=1 Tax=Pseudonocardia sp. TRM90224 TaxID=2812678 RepID=UPI001E570803|nr:secretion system protein [Pseudonocardia sp. TRM90224]